MDYVDLKPAREKAGHSLEQVAECTKIPMRHLRALESGRLRYWPRGLYVKAYAQAYAQAAGLDAPEVVALASRLIEELDRQEAPAIAEPVVSRWWQTVDVRGWLIRA